MEFQEILETVEFSPLTETLTISHVFCYFRCALLELWSEGTAPFEFSQLLAYRAGESELVQKHLDQLENENLRSLIASMISLKSEDRKSAEIYLDEEKGR